MLEQIEKIFPGFLRRLRRPPFAVRAVLLVAVLASAPCSDVDLRPSPDRGSRCSLWPVTAGVRRTGSAVDVAAMTDLEDDNSEVIVLSLIRSGGSLEARHLDTGDSTLGRRIIELIRTGR